MSEEPKDPGSERYRMPKWVKVSLIVFAVLVLGFVISMFAGVHHGPGLHGGG